MRSIILSRSIELPASADVEVAREDAADFVRTLTRDATGAAGDGLIYLCGGGELAGYLARNGLIDRLVLKRAPIVLGGGTPLFGVAGAALQLRRLSTRDYADGALLQVFQVMLPTHWPNAECDTAGDRERRPRTDSGGLRRRRERPRRRGAAISSVGVS